MKRLRLGTAALAALLFAGGVSAAPAACEWPAWNLFRQGFVSEGGRVVDRGTANSQTTSEGQSYALFFALIANDRESFARLLRWTEDNLSGGDLTARLPAWQWGKRDDGTWGVLDANAASDADLWIAYSLAEAGRLWNDKRYSALAELLATRILDEESAVLPGLGRTLLPGPQGFALQAGVWKLNPSYLPLQLLRRMATLYPQSGWKKTISPSFELLVRTAPHGFSPEWSIYRAGTGFQPDPDTQGKGSHNAIRVYLWAGMLADDEPLRAVLLKTLAPMAAAVAGSGTPPLETLTREGKVAGTGSAGFSAALLPFLAAAKQPEALRRQQLRVEAKAPSERDDNYYDQVLTLFGGGWIEGRYRFERDGALKPNWTCAGN